MCALDSKRIVWRIASILLWIFSSFTSGNKRKEETMFSSTRNQTVSDVLMCDVEMNLTRLLLNPVVYDRSVRPARNHRDVTVISFDLSLAQLIDVDEKNQVITTNQWITMVNTFRRRHCSNVFSRLELARSKTDLGSLGMGQCQSASY